MAIPVHVEIPTGDPPKTSAGGSGSAEPDYRRLRTGQSLYLGMRPVACLPARARKGFGALVPGVLCVVLFALLTRDPRRGHPEPVSLRVPMPAGFWRLMLPVAIFGIGNFATAFFTLRAVDLMQPELTHSAALAAAVGAHTRLGLAARAAERG